MGGRRLILGIVHSTRFLLFLLDVQRLMLPSHSPSLHPSLPPSQTANGAMDARDSSISSLKHQLHLEQAKVKAFEQQVPELESRLSSAQEELQQTKRGLEEKVQALGQARRHLKNARERNMVRGQTCD